MEIVSLLLPYASYTASYGTRDGGNRGNGLDKSKGGERNENVNVNFSIHPPLRFAYIFRRDFRVGSFFFSKLSPSFLLISSFI